MTFVKKMKKQNPFVIIECAYIQDEKLSWKARGLLSYLLSLPEHWQINVKDLVNRAPDGRDAVYSILKELKTTGYVVHEQNRENARLAKSKYWVYEQPQLPCKKSLVAVSGTENLPPADFLDTKKQGARKPYSENSDTYITNREDNKQLAKKQQQ